MRNRTPLNGRKLLPAAIAVLAITLAGCSAAGPSTAAAPPTSTAPSAKTHTMPDGSTMSDKDMAKMKHAADPSPAAGMVCTGDVPTSVARIFAVDKTPHPTSTWANQIFTCTYKIGGDSLVLAVHDATDPAAGRAYFDELRTKLGTTKSLDGMVGLGFPAYETAGGRVVFLKDGKTLQVDASQVKSHRGADGDMSRTDLAYAVAAAVLACWSEHAG